MSGPVTDAPAPAPGPSPARRRWSRRLMTASAALGLLGIGVSVIHFVWPTPLMFALFWAVGQTSFGIAMILYIAVIFIDLRRSRVL